MDRAFLDHLDPTQLAKMLDPDCFLQWPETDAADILRHQLRAPLLPDLGVVPGAELARLKSLVLNGAGTESFVRQLTSTTPSIELLIAIKRFARHFRDVPENPLHAAPARVLYYASIAAALIRCNTRITHLGDSELCAGFFWAKVQPGAEALAPILASAEQELSLTQ